MCLFGVVQNIPDNDKTTSCVNKRTVLLLGKSSVLTMTELLYVQGKTEQCNDHCSLWKPKLRTIQ